CQRLRTRGPAHRHKGRRVPLAAAPGRPPAGVLRAEPAVAGGPLAAGRGVLAARLGAALPRRPALGSPPPPPPRAPPSSPPPASGSRRAGFRAVAPPGLALRRAGWRLLRGGGRAGG